VRGLIGQPIAHDASAPAMVSRTRAASTSVNDSMRRDLLLIVGRMMPAEEWPGGSMRGADLQVRPRIGPLCGYGCREEM